MNAHDYDEGFKSGFRKARILQHRYAWFKLFCLVVLASFAAHFIWEFIVTLV